MELLREVAEFTTNPIIASGGVSKLADVIEIAKIANLGIEGVIIGKAIYEGKFTIAEALVSVR